MPSRTFAGSLRDPAGRVFQQDGVVYRALDEAGRPAYERLMASGLYRALVDAGLLIPHEDLGPRPELPDTATILQPERIPMVSYPYEWCFSELRDAALATLRAERLALEHGMSLKDASAYNVQFLRGRAVLIDTLSFETFQPRPWFAYRQFCQHFYAPLLLASAVDARLLRLLQVSIDGAPLDLTSRLLSRPSWLRIGPLVHVHLHAAAARRWEGRHRAEGRPVLSSTLRQRLALVDSLEHAVLRLRWSRSGHWTSYYRDLESYAPRAFQAKEETVTRWLDHLKPKVVWDLGANTGHFSRLAAGLGATVVALDADMACIESLYSDGGRGDLLPLVVDLAAPSPAIGWANEERMSLAQRGPADLVLALALVHHLAIANTLPLSSIAAYVARLGRAAIIEFVPRSDPMVGRMLASRDDVFEGYTVEAFEHAFAEFFIVRAHADLAPSARRLYLMTVR